MCSRVPLGWGINGVWMGMFISIAFESFLMFAWYWRGTWKTEAGVIPPRLPPRGTSPATTSFAWYWRGTWKTKRV